MQRWIQTLKPTWWSGLGMLVLALGASGHSMAATITVTALGDGSIGCTLRRAISNANAADQGASECERGDAGSNEIRFAPAAQAIVLAAGNGPLLIQSNLTITGNGASSTSISGGSLVRVLDIPVGSNVALGLNGLTVSNGKALVASTMSNAGGLFIPAGSTATLSNCAFRSNDAQSSGGAIENRGALTINSCTFIGNTAAGEGGAIRNIGTMTVDRSVFNSNTADRGGAVWVNRTAVTTIDLTNSKFGANTGGSIGGAVNLLGTAVMNATGSSATLITTGSVYSATAYPETPPTVAVQPTTAVTVGGAANLSVALTGSGSTPTGSVSLFSGADAIADCSNLVLDNAGTASCSTTALAVGVHTITAQYSGNATYLPATSAGRAQVINGATNADTKQVTVTGPQGAEVWTPGGNQGTITAIGKLTVTLDTPAPDGDKTFLIETKTAGGGATLVSGTLVLTRDGTPPVFSALRPADGEFLRAGSTVGYTLSEDVVAGATIMFTRTGGTADSTQRTCTLQGTALASGAHVVALTADANGCSAPLGLVDGAVYTLAFNATDTADNPAVTASITGVTYDSSAPSAPVVTSPANNASAEGSSVVISGTAEAGSRVEVYEGATLLGSATATGGNFSVTVAGLSFALHNFTLKAIDAAGNESGTTALAYTAQVPSSGGGSPPPAVVTQGTATVTPGTPVTIGGSVQVTASPGSTITLNPQSGGSTITLPPTGSGGTPTPVTLVIGGQTFSIQPQPNTSTVLSVVTLTGANGQPQVALVLNPSTSGDSQVTLSGTVSQGTVVALLSTSTGNLPLTAQGDGVVSVTLITTPRAAAGTPQSWSVFVRTGRVALPPAANGAAAVTVYSGEVARLDGAGKVQSVRLGTVAGNGLGDPVQRGDLPAGINANVGFVRLAGVPTRTGGSTLLETLVNNGLRTVGITSGAQAADGSVTWTLGGVSFPVVALEVRVAPARADGVTVADDGSIEVATAGLVTRFGPALQSLPAMGQALTALGATTVMQPNGALRVSLGSTVFHLRAQWLPMGRTGNAPGFVFHSTTGLVFTDANGVSQALQGDVADYEGLTSLLQSLLGTSTVLRTGLDLQTELTLGSQRFLLVPDLALLPAGSGPANSNWWFEGAKLFVRYPGGLVQGFAVTAR